MSWADTTREKNNTNGEHASKCAYKLHSQNIMFYFSVKGHIRCAVTQHTSSLMSIPAPVIHKSIFSLSYGAFILNSSSLRYGKFPEIIACTPTAKERDKAVCQALLLLFASKSALIQLRQRFKKIHNTKNSLGSEYLGCGTLSDKNMVSMRSKRTIWY